MKREIKSEIVTVRLTPAERARLDDMGGAAEVLRRVLQLPPLQVVPVTTSGHQRSIVLSGCGIGTSWWVWDDGTVGSSWPALETR